MKSDHVKFRRTKETNFLVVDEFIFDKLSPYALKVYGQLRKLTSYTKQNDETEITVKNLALASGISERKTYDVLNELEYEHYLIQRLNIYHIRWGQINSFNVSQTYGYYSPELKKTSCAHETETEPVDKYGQNLTPPARSAVPPARSAVPPARSADLKEQESFQESFKKKQNNKTYEKPVSVFSDITSVKKHIEEIICKRGAFVENQVIDEGVYYSYDKNPDKSFDSVNKRINIFLKKVREGNWFIPQGFGGLTSQQIREEEETHYINKRAEYAQEAHVMKSIFTASKQGEGFKAFGEMFKKLKSDLPHKRQTLAEMRKKAV